MEDNSLTVKKREKEITNRFHLAVWLYIHND